MRQPADNKLIPITAWLVRLTGAVALVSPLLRYHGVLYRAARVMPISPVHLSGTLSIIAGATLIYLADQLQSRKQQAFYLTMALLVILLIAELIHFHNPLPAIMSIGLLIALFIERRDFTVRSDTVSIQVGLRRAGLLILIAVAYGTLGFLLLGQRGFSISFTPGAALFATLRQFLSLNNAIEPTSYRGRLFLDSIDILGITTFVLVLGSLFRPLRFRFTASQSDRMRAQTILQHYGGTTEDYFKLWPADKHYYFSRDGQAFLAYGVKRGVALALDGPSGQPDSFAGLLADFQSFCGVNGWLPAIVHAEANLADTLPGGDWKRYSIGNEAVIDVASFTHTTLRDKHFRYVMNKSQRDGLGFEIWQPPLSSERIHALREISDAWLSQDGRREYRFIMGYFEADYLTNCQIGVLTLEGRPVAYANLVPSFDPAAVSIDHMRSQKGISPVSMHFLLARLIQHSAEAGKTSFNLGLAPLAQDSQGARSLGDNILRGLKTLIKPVYSFEGVAQFKQKFHPVWSERYLFFDGKATDLPRIGLALYDLVTFSNQK